MRILFIRHGETETNAAGLLHAQEDPASLSERGRDQVGRLASALREYHPEALYASPEKRGRETSAILSQEFNLIVRDLPEFQERNWGQWSGKKWTDVEKELAGMDLEQCYTFSPPDGESWKEVEERVRKGLSVVTSSSCETVAVVTHGGVLRTLMPLVTSLPRESSFRYDMRNASITVVDWDGAAFHVVLVDDVSHLDV